MDKIKTAGDALRHVMSFEFLGDKVCQVVTFSDGTEMRAMMRLGYMVMPDAEANAVSRADVWLYLRWSKVGNVWQAALSTIPFDVNIAGNTSGSTPTICTEWHPTLWVVLDELTQTYRGMVHSCIQTFEAVFGVKVPEEAQPSELFPSAALKVMWSIEQAHMEDQRRIKNQEVIESIVAEVVADNEAAAAALQEAPIADPE